MLGYVYNPLKKLFLANKPEKVISQSMAYVSSHQNILIVGGGADNTLEKLVAGHKSKKVTHVDVSSVLSEKGRDRFSVSSLSRQAQVQFVVAPFLDFRGAVYDAIIFPFYLDLFSDDEVRENIMHAKSMLANNGVIYVIDFSSAVGLNSWFSLKIKLLYALFAPISKVYRSNVPDYPTLFTECGLTLVSSIGFYKGEYALHIFNAGH